SLGRVSGFLRDSKWTGARGRNVWPIAGHYAPGSREYIGRYRDRRGAKLGGSLPKLHLANRRGPGRIKRDLLLGRADVGRNSPTNLEVGWGRLHPWRGSRLDQRKCDRGDRISIRSHFR